MKIKEWRFEAESQQDVRKIKLKRVVSKRTKQFTLEFVGYSAVHNPSTLFGIYYKRKILPLLEISLDISQNSVILRYQGDTSFQRTSISFTTSLVNWKVLSVSINKTHFTVNVGCKEEQSVKLKQKLVTIPRKAFGILGSGKSGENRFVVSIHISF